MFRFHISFMCHFFTPVCSHRLSSAIHQTFFSRLAGAQFADRITCLAPAVLFQFEHTLSKLTCFTHAHTHTHTHTHTFFSLNICLKTFCFFLCFMWPICQRCSVEPSYTFLVAWPAHNSLIVISASPARTLFGFAQTIPFNRFTYI